jgi:hypothetical protein
VYQWGRGGGETTLSERLPCGHTGAFHNFNAVPSEGGPFGGPDAGWDCNYREFARYDGLGRPYTGRVPFRVGYMCTHSAELFDL